MEGSGRQESVPRAIDILVEMEDTSLRGTVIFRTQHRASENEIVSLRRGGLWRSYAGADTSLISDGPVVTVFKLPKYDSNNSVRRASLFMNVVRAISMPRWSSLLESFDVSSTIQRRDLECYLIPCTTGRK